MLFLDESPKLNETDIAIYRFILNNLEITSFMNVRELAERTHTSTASIIRFCKKFQCAGFSDFKVKLRLYIDKAESLNETADLDESLIINFMQRTTEKIYQQKIAEVAKLLASKELIFLIGIGSSKVTAEYGALYFSSIFNMSVSIQNPLLNPVSYITRDLANKICIIALSVSGETEIIINYLTHFVKSEATIVSITNSSKCTIAEMSDINIPYYINTEKIKSADITSQVPAIFTIEKLAKQVNRYRLKGT